METGEKLGVASTVFESRIEMILNRLTRFFMNRDAVRRLLARLSDPAKKIMAGALPEVGGALSLVISMGLFRDRRSAHLVSSYLNEFFKTASEEIAKAGGPVADERAAQILANAERKVDEQRLVRLVNHAHRPDCVFIVDLSRALGKAGKDGKESVIKRAVEDTTFKAAIEQGLHFCPTCFPMDVRPQEPENKSEFGQAAASKPPAKKRWRSVMEVMADESVTPAERQECDDWLEELSPPDRDKVIKMMAEHLDSPAEYKELMRRSRAVRMTYLELLKDQHGRARKAFDELDSQLARPVEWLQKKWDQKEVEKPSFLKSLKRMIRDFGDAILHPLT